MANTRVIDGRLHILQGNGLYVPFSISMDEAKALKGREPKKFYAGPDKKLYEAFEDVQAKTEAMAADGALVAECTKDGKTATMVRADRNIALPRLDGNGRREWEAVPEGAWLDATDWEDVHGVPDDASGQAGREHQPEGWDVSYMACSPGDAPVRYLNFKEGGPDRAPASIPVAMLFNEDSSVGEVRPLVDTDTPYAVGRLCAGDSLTASHDDLDASPLEGAAVPHQERLQDLIALRDRVLYGKEPQEEEQGSRSVGQEGPSI